MSQEVTLVNEAHHDHHHDIEFNCLIRLDQDDIIMEVFYFVGGRNMINICSRVSKQWNRISKQIQGIELDLGFTKDIWLLYSALSSPYFDQIAHLMVNTVNRVILKTMSDRKLLMKLRSLSITRIEFEEMKFLMNCKQLDNLENLTMDGSKNFWDSTCELKNLTSLQVIDARKFNFEKISCCLFAPQLKKLGVCGSSTPGCTVNNLKGFGNLTSLMLRNTSFIAIVECAEIFTNLTELDLGDNVMGDVTLSKLCDSTIFTNLERLRLDKNSISDSGIRSFVKSSFISKLKFIDLSNNRITDVGVKCISLVDNLKRLEKILLLGNDGVTTTGANYILSSQNFPCLHTTVDDFVSKLEVDKGKCIIN